MTLTEREYERLLKWSNRVRAKLDAPPVELLRRGKPQEADSCPLANTINYRLARGRRLHVDESEAYRGQDPFAPDEVIAKSPDYVERFIRDFDRGKHSELAGSGWTRS